MAPRSILILGGTRYFGRHIVDGCLDAGMAVTLMSRGTSYTPPRRPGLSWIRCDRNDERALLSAIGDRGFDTVIDNICYTPDVARSALRIFSGRCRHFVFTSSVMSYLSALLQGNAVSEDDWRSTGSTEGMTLQYSGDEIRYGVNKRGCEQLLLEQSALPVTVLRLTNVIGEDDFSKKSAELPRAVYAGAPIEGAPDDLVQQVYSRDLGALYTQCALMGPPAENRAVNVANPPLPFGDYLTHLLTAEQREIDFAEGHGAAPFPRNIVMDTAKCGEIFKTSFTPYETYLQRTASWWIHNDVPMAA